MGILESRASQKPPVTAETLLALGSIESLVKSGRIPGLFKHSRGVFVIIPPEGTELGDKITHGMGVGIGDQGYVTFESPDGVKRGASQLVGVTFEQAKVIRKSVAETLKGLEKQSV